jgi:acetyl esterase
LSPEVKFPVALNESYSVVEYLTNTKTASKLNVDPKRVVVGGDSAGGNLSAAVSCKVL